MYYFKIKPFVWMLPLQLNSFDYSGNIAIICLNIYISLVLTSNKDFFLGFSWQGEIKLAIMKAIFFFM